MSHARWHYSFAMEAVSCQVCRVDLSNDTRYSIRCRLCKAHRNATRTFTEIDGFQRFCQQCAVLHPVQYFEGDRRSCVRALGRQRALKKRTRKVATAEVGAYKKQADRSAMLHASAIELTIPAMRRQRRRSCHMLRLAPRPTLKAMPSRRRRAPSMSPQWRSRSLTSRGGVRSSWVILCLRLDPSKPEPEYGSCLLHATRGGSALHSTNWGT